MPKTAVITGGAGGMGLATARILGHDHRVVISDVNGQRLDDAVTELKELGVEADGVVCDITDRAAVTALFTRAGESGPVTAVVHTAGVSPQMGSADTIIRINALGTIHVTQAALAVAGEGFALVNVASIAGHMLPGFLIPKRAYKLADVDVERFTQKLVAAASRGPKASRPGSAYSLSKNFVIWYSQRQAAAFGAKGARILSVSPGSFDTAMGRLEEASGAGKLLDHAALKRFGRADEIAELLAFCAGDRPGYLTGTDILCDGGTRAGLTLKGMIAMARGA
ncbi:NAD(P)-dependent dehydrogenase, short-chain alcohol dehydrogenase family [Parafrankia irregularis]|uniref:NAD(P)-dependent dehydrogenase, short-chain alcohol dehydrogenase family n=1 Tax=Parafrankia irregularis TaxID=795642 RepID=A0A0S4QX92_9ACTN|nr:MULTISPECIES: SDR family oxidoreductase [Parafrankia]MBE3205792.1 SDR family oxidoreductase [Parafrankia sp. CH37]CUU59666.1 NAD(P)-dependent dehydrogenase, short-chain alcohol dehydrogenase family [Parafrankia irregularis]